MQYHWLHQTANTRLILLFGGWGMDYHPFAPLPSTDYDVLVFYDYRDLSLPVDLKSLFAKYTEVMLIGWSLGVWVAERVCAGYASKFKTALAINGTLNPVDDQEGILTALFAGTLENLSDANLVRFNRRMFRHTTERKIFDLNLPHRPMEELKDELSHLKNRILPIENSLFGKALIGADDLIFSPENQLRYWQGRAQIIEKQVAHFPFYAFRSWDNLLNEFTSYND